MIQTRLGIIDNNLLLECPRCIATVLTVFTLKILYLFVRDMHVANIQTKKIPLHSQ